MVGAKTVDGDMPDSAADDVHAASHSGFEDNYVDAGSSASAAAETNIENASPQAARRKQVEAAVAAARAKAAAEKAVACAS